MESPDVLDEVSLPFRLQFAVRTLDQLGEVDLSDVVAEVPHGAGGVLADGAAVSVLQLVVVGDELLGGGGPCGLSVGGRRGLRGRRGRLSSDAVVWTRGGRGLPVP